MHCFSIKFEMLMTSWKKINDRIWRPPEIGGPVPPNSSNMPKTGPVDTVYSASSRTRLRCATASRKSALISSSQPYTQACSEHYETTDRPYWHTRYRPTPARYESTEALSSLEMIESATCSMLSSIRASLQTCLLFCRHFDDSYSS